jgi:hypothetical protein
MKHALLLPLALLSVLACSKPDTRTDEPTRADAVADAELPVVRYYVIGDA